MSDNSESRRVAFSPALNAAPSTPHEQLVQQLGEGNGPQPDAPGDQTNASAAGPDEETIRDRVIEALKTIYDPEIPVNIYDLGLIYKVDVKGRFVAVDMTLTAPGCPVAQTFPGMVEGSVRLVPGVEDAVVELVWDPPWRQDMISESARLELGLL